MAGVVGLGSLRLGTPNQVLLDVTADRPLLQPRRRCQLVERIFWLHEAIVSCHVTMSTSNCKGKYTASTEEEAATGLGLRGSSATNSRCRLLGDHRLQKTLVVRVF